MQSKKMVKGINEIGSVIYSENRKGTVSNNIFGSTASTLRDNTEFKNFPSAIGVQSVDNHIGGATDTRDFQSGMSHAFPGSITIEKNWLEKNAEDQSHIIAGMIFISLIVLVKLIILF